MGRRVYPKLDLFKRDHIYEALQISRLYGRRKSVWGSHVRSSDKKGLSILRSATESIYKVQRAQSHGLNPKP